MVMDGADLDHAKLHAGLNRLGVNVDRSYIDRLINRKQGIGELLAMADVGMDGQSRQAVTSKGPESDHKPETRNDSAASSTRNS